MIYVVTEGQFSDFVGVMNSFTSAPWPKQKNIYIGKMGPECGLGMTGLYVDMACQMLPRSNTAASSSLDCK